MADCLEALDSSLGLEADEDLELPEEPVADALAEEEEEATAAFIVMGIVVFTLVLVDSKTTYKGIVINIHHVKTRVVAVL